VHRRAHVAGWVAAAAVAPLVAFGTLMFVRGAVGGQTVVGSLSQAEVQAQLSAAVTASAASGRPGTGPTVRPSPTGTRHPTASASPHASQSVRPTPSLTAHGSHTPAPTHSSGGGSPSPSPSTVTRLLTSVGGSVVASCTGSGAGAQVYLVSWSPAQGFTVNGPVNRGPGQQAEIEFDSGGQSVDVHVACSASGPVQSVSSGGGDE
jgi:hypothetical protein